VEIGALPTIDADPLQMRQLMQNLIANGLKFHRTGVPPVVQLSAADVPGAAPDAGPGAGPDGNGRPPDAAGPSTEGPAGGFVELHFKDNGIGFDEKYLDRIFTVFQRLHGRGEYEGTGIGLAVCRKIVERHGGRITARSRPGEGATFVVTLPRRQPAADDPVPDDRALGAAPQADARVPAPGAQRAQGHAGER
jgi:signal transduction histidine kinase